MSDLHPTVCGYCPACSDESLFLGSGGYVTCARLDCPDPEAATRTLETRGKPAEITVQHLAYWRPACPAGLHINHPGYTCDEADQLAAAGRELLNAAARAFDAATTDPPAALRGPNWKARP